MTDTSIADELAINNMSLSDEPAASDNVAPDEKIALDDKLSPKEPASFLTLARELRQKILAETYDPEEDMSEYHEYWSVSAAKEEIETRVNALRKVDGNISYREDIDFVKAKWLEELEKFRQIREQRAEKYWRRMSDEDREEAWGATRDGWPPWKTIHFCLSGLGQAWWDEMEGYVTRFGKGVPEDQYSVSLQQALIEDPELLKRGDYPPWHKATNEILSFGRNDDYVSIIGRWTSGGSGLTWDVDGRGHYLSTWNKMEEDMRKDFKWLVETANEFLSTLLAKFKHISVYSPHEGALTIGRQISANSSSAQTFG